MKTLLIVDLQNDFVEGGALPVTGGRAIVPLINKLMPRFDHVVASLDYHPKGHVSFAESHEGKQVGDVVEVEGVQQYLWPTHCVAEEFGSELVEELECQKVDKFVLKGTDLNIDSYSAFYNNNRSSETGLVGYLKSIGATELYVCGLAADYCVLFSVLDALSEGFDTTLITDATPAINVSPDDGEKAVEKMREAGAHIITSKEVFDESFSD